MVYQCQGTIYLNNNKCFNESLPANLKVDGLASLLKQIM